MRLHNGLLMPVMALITEKMREICGWAYPLPSIDAAKLQGIQGSTLKQSSNYREADQTEQLPTTVAEGVSFTVAVHFFHLLKAQHKLHNLSWCLVQGKSISQIPS